MDRVVLDGMSLSLPEVVRVARFGATVGLSPESVRRMSEGRRIADDERLAGRPVYGLTTGVGAMKRVAVDPGRAPAFNRELVLNSRVGQGALAGEDVVRATMLRLANALARGNTGVRPELAQMVVDELNARHHPRVRTLGSVGIADLAPLADLAHAMVDSSGYVLGDGEGLALVSSNAFATALAALAVHDCLNLLDALEVGAALSAEAFAANLSILSPVAELRPYPGLLTTVRRMRELLHGSGLWHDHAARNLQDPLTFRCAPQVLGALRDTLDYVSGQLAVELNAAQHNPLVDFTHHRLVSAGSSDPIALSAALDFARIALAPALTSAAERTVKLLTAEFSGLRAGLAAGPDLADDGYTELGVATQAITAEARLLAAPVSFEMVSSSQAEGIEDRTTMAPLAARRLADMTGLGARVVAIELTVAARAVDLRSGRGRLGAGTRAAHDLVRSCVGDTAHGEPVPQDLEPLVDLVRGGQLSTVSSPRGAADLTA